MRLTHFTLENIGLNAIVKFCKFPMVDENCGTLQVNLQIFELRLRPISDTNCELLFQDFNSVYLTNPDPYFKIIGKINRCNIRT